MFVRSRIDKPLTFRKNGKSWILKPHSITLIDDFTVTAKEIKGCYGSRVDVISDEGTQVTPSEGRQIPKNVIKCKEKSSKKDDKSIDDILEQVNKELGESKIGNKKVDTSKDDESNPEEVFTGDSDDNIPKGKDPEPIKKPVKTPKTSKDIEAGKSKPARRTTKKATSKKGTRKRTKNTNK